jgi:23S rRNA-/tRNA-specific pseudouridylate synthase
MAKVHEFENGTKMQVRDDGQITKSHYRVLEHHGNCTRLEVHLETGKTHQIRVHLAHIGVPIIGDVRYGNQPLDNEFFKEHDAQKRLYLHAERIVFKHPVTKKQVVLVAPVPTEFGRVMQSVR